MRKKWPLQSLVIGPELLFNYVAENVSYCGSLWHPLHATCPLQARYVKHLSG